ncbi:MULTISPECIES: DUF6708 domain-containing protein [unclassified Pseudomonas]|uniref:DUF6708 domain-containing protein n=1 Tax=unclassified Pseudomonas TaxID=196821 RepID=UPI0021BB5927|nr:MULTISPECIES: DUF6708 domain-containing protein [unclassified Pseudomonas]
MCRPLLNPPCTGWQEDLPGPGEKVAIEASLCRKSPNYQDGIYLEIPRSSISFRGVFIFFSLLTAYSVFDIPRYIVDAFFEGDTEFLFTGSLVFLVSVWSTLFSFKIAVCPPRDEPLRFNRLRRKIYAYNFKHTWWNPFAAWTVVPVSYDWSQVRAERWSQMGGLPNGGVIYKAGVVLSIVEPGTNVVIDRFPLGTMGADEHAWAYICTYMQEGPAALPIPDPPKDHNDVLWCEFALRLAPKVTWPADMDLESRTAP